MVQRIIWEVHELQVTKDASEAGKNPCTGKVAPRPATPDAG